MQLWPQVIDAPKRASLHFILHGAFCGSTLLARYLEEIPHSFVLKEPQVLAQLFDTAAFDPRLWVDWFRVTMALLARAYAPDSVIIVKAPDLCNWMGDLLLDHDKKTKIIFLSSPLKVFLLSVLKAEHRRRWVRQRALDLDQYLAKLPFPTQSAGDGKSDGQCGAAIWLLNSFLCKSLLERPDSDRILPLISEDLICRPRDVLDAAADFFGFTRDESTRTAPTHFRPLSHHAKDPQLPYDATTRQDDYANATAEFGGEVEAAIGWAKKVSSGWLSDSPFPID